MKAISKLIRSGDKIPKEKIFQFRFEDDKVEDVKSTSLKKAVKSFQKWCALHCLTKNGLRIPHASATSCTFN